MSRKGLAGQLSMFDFWGAQAGAGEVEMVSLMPEPEEQVKESPKTTKEVPVEVEAEVAIAEVSVEKTPEKRENPVGESGDTPVMHSEKRDRRGKILEEISYVNYNKVFLQREGDEGETFQFDNSKEAVDFYIAEMLKLGCGEE